MRIVPLFPGARAGMAIVAKRKKTGGWLKRLMRSFALSDRGVTALEFALLGPVFFAIIGATIETALTFFAGYALDTAVIDSSRLIRTGQLTRVASAQDYRTEVCGQLYGMFDCDELRISVKEFTSFAPSDPVEETSGAWLMPVDQNLPQFKPSTSYFIEAYYKWPTFANIPGLNAGQTADGKRLLATAHVIQTEPFP